VVVRQGDVFWATLGAPFGSEPGHRRPVLVVQSDLFNRTTLPTVVVVAVTSNPRMAEMPGNVRLEAGEANLPKSCCANVTHVVTLDRRRLAERLGRLPAARLSAVLDGLDLVMRGVR